MVIAHVLSSFALGGQERVALDLARRQARRHHEVLAFSLAAGEPADLAERFRAAGVSTFDVPKGRGFDPTLPARLAWLLRAAHAQVVHTHNPHALVYGAPAGRLAGARVVHTKHGMNPDGPRRMWLRRMAARLVDAYVAVTPTLAEVARARRECDPARLFIVPNGIDVARFAPSPVVRRSARAELGIPEHAWVVGTVGRLAPEKDQALLVRALAPVLGPDVRLVIVGDGPERASLEALAARHGGGHVIFTGARSDPERMLAAFDVFALTSRTEGLPLVVLEAMALGLPVVSTDVGGIKDVVRPGSTGALVEAGDGQALAAELERLERDRALARALGERGQKSALADYTLDVMVSRYEKLYERLSGYSPVKLPVSPRPSMTSTTR